MRGSNFEIIALQKTHATNDPSEISAEEWTGDSVWDNKSNISCGLALLFRPGIASGDKMNGP